MAGPAWLAAAVPVSTKKPVPMIAPMPSSVRSMAVSVRLSAFAPCSASPTSCSIDLVFRIFESIHPPGNRPAKTGRLYLERTRRQGASEGANTRFDVLVNEKIGDHRDRVGPRRNHVRRALQRDAADRDDRLAAARGVAHESQPAR